MATSSVISLPDPSGDELALVDALRRRAEPCVALYPEARARADKWLACSGERQMLDRLLSQYELSSEQGLAIMALAEALLRIPNKRTAERLLRDKLADTDWLAAQAEGAIGRASAWGLALGAQWLNFDRRGGVAEGIKRALAPLSQNLIHTLVSRVLTLMATRFVCAETIEQALAECPEGRLCSFDMLGESARCSADAERYFSAYQHAIAALGEQRRRAPVNALRSSPHAGHGISVKLSALHPRFELAQFAELEQQLLPRLIALAEVAARADIALCIDAETCATTELTLSLLQRLASEPGLGDWQGLGLAVQAYQKRAPAIIDKVVQIARDSGRELSVRLVKGAYWDSEIQTAQRQGLRDYPVFTRKAHTDISYLACACQLLDYSDYLYPQFASHNALSLALVAQLAEARGLVREQFECQRLYGMGEALHAQIGARSRVYAPVGERRALLAYLVRRMLENGANSSFVQQQYQLRARNELLANPLDVGLSLSLPKPLAIFAERRAARGGDLWRAADWRELQWRLEHEALPLPACAGSGELAVYSPARPTEPIARLPLAGSEQVARAFAALTSAQGDDHCALIEQRAEQLLVLADKIETARFELLQLCVRECGKTCADALDDIREAVDFCRYYAHQARELLGQHHWRPLGTVVCISPWNFPVAIFIGQLAAALAAGNRVVAKPATAASLTASYVFELIRAAGFGEADIQLLCLPGAMLGEQLLGRDDIDGVLFTGSCDVAKAIARQLAAAEGEPRLLVAETGGINAAIVDASALLEQVVDALLRSAFNSAGQRCSAARLVFVQEDVADELIDMLCGAMAELKVGDPLDLSVDIGPLISAEVKAKLQAHCDRLEQLPDAQARLLYDAKTLAGDGHYFAPRLYQIASAELLDEEVFGPVLHLVRFAESDLQAVIDAVNASGYGLTLGIHSRIERSQRFITRQLTVGNIYINRNQVGAQVGCQPFGGNGLSGTGPKAGGPNYLLRLTRSCAPLISAGAQLDLPSAAKAPAEYRCEPWQDVLQKLAAIAPQPVEARLQALEKLLALLKAEAPALARDAASASRLLDQLAALGACGRSLLLEPVPLEAIAGEHNRLQYLPRGVLLLVCRDSLLVGQWLLQLIAALLAGNRVLLLCSDFAAPIVDSGLGLLARAGFDQTLWQRWAGESYYQLPRALVDSSVVFHGVIDHPVCAQRAQLARALAAREGPLLPLLAEPFGPGFLQRFALEQVVSVDTSAAAGNIELFNRYQ